VMHPARQRTRRRCRRICCWGGVCTRLDRGWQWRQRSLHRYRLVRTPLRGGGAVAEELRGVWRARGGGVPGCARGLGAAARLLIDHGARGAAGVLRLRALWRVICFSLCSFFVSKQWGDTETMLIPFLERHFGEDGAASVASFWVGGVTEIYLCNVCSCQERLRRNGRG
jgi:hypothetical protein